MTPSAFDLLLCLTLVAGAGLALFGGDLFRSLVLFILFGVLMAIAWVRLDAPDLALAEAAVGAGVTGALLLSAWRRLDEGRAGSPLGLPWWPLALLLLAPLAWQTLSVVWTLIPGVGLRGEVLGQLGHSGVTSPVTAVLLNFRGYDTMLELAVLLLALVAAGQPLDEQRQAGSQGLLLSHFGALLLPLILLLAGYLLWQGGGATGGAFQAGALVGAAAILARLSRPDWVAPPSAPGWRVATLLGPALFLLVAGATALTGAMLAYPGSAAGGLILLIESAATLSIGAALFGLYRRTADGGEVGKR